MIRVESRGSVWELDEDLGRYRRMPKREAPRDRPEWSDERAGALQDFTWHPMASWRILDRDYMGEHPTLGLGVLPAGTLVIDTGTDMGNVTAPQARLL